MKPRDGPHSSTRLRRVLGERPDDRNSLAVCFRQVAWRKIPHCTSSPEGAAHSRVLRKNMEDDMSKNVLVPIADGSEELELIAVVDILRRAGATVTIASVGPLQITGSKGIRIGADRLIGECLGEIFDLIVLPGGMPGAGHLRDCELLIDYIRRHNDEGRLLAAICAAPVVILHHHNLLKGRNFTCHPYLTQLLGSTKTSESAVVVDKKLVTSRGAGTAVQFSLKLVEILYDRQKVRDVAAGMALPLSQMIYL